MHGLNKYRERADGKFALFVSARQRADSVRVSSLGYASASVPARGTAALAARLVPHRAKAR